MVTLHYVVILSLFNHLHLKLRIEIYKKRRLGCQQDVQPCQCTSDRSCLVSPLPPPWNSLADCSNPEQSECHHCFQKVVIPTCLASLASSAWEAGRAGAALLSAWCWCRLSCSFRSSTARALNGKVPRRDFPPRITKAESSFWFSKEARLVVAAIRRWESTWGRLGHQ